MKTFHHRLFFHRAFRYFAGFILLLFAFSVLRYWTVYKYEPHRLVKTTLEKIQSIDNQENTAIHRMFDFLLQKNTPSWKQLNDYVSRLEEDMVVFKGDSLLFWNSNRIPLRDASGMEAGQAEILFSGSRPYLALKSEKGRFTVMAFVPLDKKALPYGVRLLKDVPQGEKNIFSVRKFNIALVAEPNVYPPLLVSLLFVLYAFLILYAAVAVYFLYKKLKQKGSGPYPFLFFLFVLFLFRMLLLWLGFPAFFDASFWTTTKITHLAGFVSPGDLLIDFLLFCFVLWVFFQYLAGCTGKWTRSVWLRLAAVQPWVFLLPVLLYVITERILQNSGLMLYPENVYFSMTGVIRLSLMLVVNLFIYLWVGAFVSFFRTKGVSFRQQVFSLLGVALLFFLIPGLEKTVILLSCFVTLVLMSVFWFSERTKRPYFHSILSILVLSLSAAYLLNANELENRNAHQQFTANMLTQKRDPYLQYLLKSRAREILRDATIIQIIRSGHPDKEREIARYLNKNYFHGLLSAYRKQVTLCEPGQQLEIQPDNKVVGCDAFFRGLKGETVDTLSGFELSLVNNTSESIYYLARFRYLPGTAGNEPVNLYVEFYTNIIPKGLGYPELLQNAETGDLHLSGYSFAFYQNRKLEYKFGDYLFPIDFSGFRSEPERMFFRKDGFIHYILPVSKTETLIVSRPGWKVSDWLLPFSLLFILSGILLLVYVFFSYGKQIRETFSYSFSTRLQLTIFSAMMLVYVLLTVVIIYYFNFNNRQTISNNLKEKTHSVMIELQHKLASYGNNVMQNKMEIQSYLQKFSMVFFSDINLYDNSGWLIVSSRPEIFSRGLQSRLINPGAYREIEKKHKLFYLGKERIKQVTFYSSYAPFILESGEAAGIINLPYFARQSELQHTYFQMLANLINLFVITGMVGMLLMVYLSRLLTKPLQILQHKIGSVTIEKQNEKIEWNRRDEIGKLIEAYNQMVEKLEESARLLKDSAREKAWREMARQIAHEIRNPLTPMKLNVQYLQKVYAEEDPAFDEKFKMVSRSLIDQIDTLNEVVNMFSDFSKIGKPGEEVADIREVLHSTITLFKKSYTIQFSLSIPQQPVPVQVSGQDLLRIFNNLLKNAVQSMENKTEKRIDIRLRKDQTYAEVRITDNGKGISREDEEHIFQPYFTTRSKGTGLGLAIVKNLITEAGGDIRFVSEEGNGTTFILRFPLATGNKL